MEIDRESTDASQVQSEAASVTIGPRLKAERERLGLTEKQVADRLHITMHYVRALETDGFEKLPGVVFARGYIKNYALLLGLDKDELITQFDTIISNRNPSSRTVIKPGSRSNRRKQVLFWLVVVLLLGLAGYLSYWAYNLYFAADLQAFEGARLNAFSEKT